MLFVVATARRQHRLKYSITLVELKTGKLLYWVFDILLGLMLIVCLAVLIMPEGALVEPLVNDFQLTATQIRLTMIPVIFVVFDILALCIALTIAKCAVVDKGIYTAVRFLDWHHLYDYHFESGGNKVVVSSNRNGPLTLAGTTPPLKFNPDDYEKLKFILNKNKNKFVPRYELR